MCTYAGIQAHSSSTTGQGKGGFGLLMGMVVYGLAVWVAGVGRVDGTVQVWGGEVTGARYLSCNTLMIISFWHTGAGIAIWRRDVDRRFVCLPRCGAGQLLWAAGCWLLAAGHLRAGGVLFCGGVLGVRRAGNGLTGVPVVWFGSGRILGCGCRLFWVVGLAVVRLDGGRRVDAGGMVCMNCRRPWPGNTGCQLDCKNAS
jgi:hypothetical protein